MWLIPSLSILIPSLNDVHILNELNLHLNDVDNMSCCILWLADQLLDELIEETMSCVNIHSCVAEESSWGLTSWWMSDSAESLESEFSLPRHGGGVNARLSRTDASLNLWVRISCWSWKESKIQHTNLTLWKALTLALTANLLNFFRPSWARLLTSSLTSLTALIFSAGEQYLWTWDKLGSLNRLSFGRYWPRTAAWTNYVRTFVLSPNLSTQKPQNSMLVFLAVSAKNKFLEVGLDSSRVWRPRVLASCSRKEHLVSFPTSLWK